MLCILITLLHSKMPLTCLGGIYTCTMYLYKLYSSWYCWTINCSVGEKQYDHALPHRKTIHCLFRTTLLLVFYITDL